MALLVFKVTLLFLFPLVAMPLMRRATAAARHLICAGAMLASLCLPLTLLLPDKAAPIRVSTITFLVAASSQPSRSVSPLPTVLAILWMLGAALCLLRLAVAYWRMSRVLAAAIPADGFSWSDVSVPMVAGIRRPVILMPLHSNAWPAPQIAAALRHERAHIERKDLWTSLIAHLACAFFWFHPAAWAVALRMRREQESACDDAVLNSGFEPASYAEALLATVRQITSTSVIGCHMTQKPLKSRIARIFEGEMPRITTPATLRRAALCLLAVAVVIGLLNGNPRVRAAEQKVLLAQAAPAPVPPPAAAPESRPAQAPSPAHLPATQPNNAQSSDPKPAAPDTANPSEHVYRVGDGVRPPSITSMVDPIYTEEARDAKIAGNVTLSVVIGVDGRAHDITVIRGLDPGLDASAIVAVQQWEFRPGTKDGENVAVQAQVEVNFRLL